MSKFNMKEKNWKMAFKRTATFGLVKGKITHFKGSKE